jgi:hypothetical protein
VTRRAVTKKFIQELVDAALPPSSQGSTLRRIVDAKKR